PSLVLARQGRLLVIGYTQRPKASLNAAVFATLPVGGFALALGLIRQGALHLFNAVGLDHIVHLDVVLAGCLEAALKSFPDFAHVVLETLERIEAGRAVVRRENDHPLAHQADFGRALDSSLGDVATGNGADTADLEGIADDGAAKVDDPLFGFELAFQGRFDILGQLVNDVVLMNLDAALVGQGAGAFVGDDVEAHDDRVFRGGERQLHVAFRDAADGGVQHADAHFFMLEFFKFLANRLNGATEISLENDLKLSNLGFRQALQPHRGPPDLGRFLLLDLALVGDFASHGQIGNDHEQVIGIGYGVQTGDTHRHARPGLLDGAAHIVVHGADAAVAGPAHDHITPAQSAVAHQHGW